MAQPILEIPVGHYITKGGVAHFKLNVLLQTWLLGKTRTGKSTVMEDAIIGTIRSGYGCAIVDPHGSLADAVLGHMPADRLKDVVYLNPASHKVPGVGYFNTAKKELSIQHFMSTMEQKSGKGWGAQTAEWFRGAADAVCDEFKCATILEIYKFF